MKGKIFLTLSFLWIILVGFLTWWNGLKNPGADKSFHWDEWIWFGVVPAFAPYIFLLIWKPNEFAKFIGCIKSLFNSK